MKGGRLRAMNMPIVSLGNVARIEPTLHHLDDMGLFVEVVKAGSFRGAADKLEMPNSTVSRRITALEKAIGLRLLSRSTRKISLTEAGELYFARCRYLVEDARFAREELAEMLVRPSGVLRASLPVDFGTCFIAPLVADFSRLHPEISLELEVTSRTAVPATQPFDVAIRMGDLEDSNLIARRVALLPRQLYASPRYLDRLGEPKHPADLARHEFLRMSRCSQWTLSDGANEVRIGAGGRMNSNSIGMIRHLATLDAGIALLAEKVVADDLERGQLRRVLPQWQGEPIAVHAMTQTRLVPAKTQRFIEFLQKGLAGS